jgi:hypothetical protein
MPIATNEHVFHEKDMIFHGSRASFLRHGRFGLLSLKWLEDVLNQRVLPSHGFEGKIPMRLGNDLV